MKTTMDIQEYRAFDPAEVLPLYESAGWINYTRNPEMLRRAFAGSLCVLCAREEGALIGLIRAVGDGESALLVQDLLVRPEFRRRGVGTALMRALLARYPDTYQTVLFTDRTETTLAFYRSLGFIPAGEMGCEGLMRIRP